MKVTGLNPEALTTTFLYEEARVVCGYRSGSLLIINDPELRVKTFLSSGASVLMPGSGWIMKQIKMLIQTEFQPN